jgi:hypothetical protein
VIQQIFDNPLAIVPWLILLLPLAGFTVLALFGDGMKRDKEENGAGYIACAMILGSFALSVLVVARLLALPLSGGEGLRFFQPNLGRPSSMAEGLLWIDAGGFQVPSACSSTRSRRS